MEEARAQGRTAPRFTSLILRSLEAGALLARNLGHFGLRSERYCHFTSPIRRYPDLICHRALLNAIGFPRADGPRADLEAAAEWCSVRERDAMTIERAADNVARAFLLESELFESERLRARVHGRGPRR